jgi:hypothetical protein
MDYAALSTVEFGDIDSLGQFLFENALQHQVFRETLAKQGKVIPAYNLMDANSDNLDDWLLSHQDEHQALANLLRLDNPENMLDVDWNVEDDFYDWIASHLYIHEQIASALKITS